MPPPGHGTHHYHFKIYALDKPLSAPPGMDKKTLLAEMQDHVLAHGRTGGNVSAVTGKKSQVPNLKSQTSSKFE